MVSDIRRLFAARADWVTLAAPNLAKPHVRVSVRR